MELCPLAVSTIRLMVSHFGFEQELERYHLYEDNYSPSWSVVTFSDIPYSRKFSGKFPKCCTVSENLFPKNFCVFVGNERL